MENSAFKVLGFPGGAHADNADAEIQVIQRQLDALRLRLISEGNTKGAALSVDDRVRIVRNFCHARDMRKDLIGGDLFSDPAWDILLEVYLAELKQQRVWISKVGLRSAIPQSTIGRWLTKLQEVGLLVKRDDPLDARRVFVSLSDRGLSAMNSYLDECWPLLSCTSPAPAEKV